MPEIKHQFTGGKMNKDVDERLVPNGEYRDAMNIQVSTSEGSDVGTAQNILGNSLVPMPINVDFIGDNAFCVGSIADEKNDAFYWFITTATSNAFDALAGFGSSSAQPTFGLSHIVEHKNNIITPVFTDVSYVIYSMYDSSGNPSYDLTAQTLTFNSPPTYIKAGMYLDIQDGVSGSLLETNTVTSVVGNVVTFEDPLDNLASLNTGGNQWIHTTTLFFSANGITGGSSGEVLGFERDNLITGINIVDDLLFWTDGKTEPKKINIPRSIEGTGASGLEHTKLIVNGIDRGLIKEKNITVIKRAPKKGVSMTLTTSRDPNLNYSGIFTISDANNLAQSSLWDQRDPLNVNANYPYDLSTFTTDEGSNIIRVMIKSDLDGNTNFSLDGWGVGSKVAIKEVDASGNIPQIPINDYTIKGVVTEWLYTNSITGVTSDTNHFTSSGSMWGVKLAIKVNSMSRVPKIAVDGTYDFVIDLFDESEKLYEFKLPRFSHRYKYEDGEYSYFAPWTDIAFNPGSFDYHPKKGYNLGMTNTTQTVRLRDFITNDMPKDVVEIDILYKEEKSPNIYVVDTFKPSDYPTIPSGGGFSNNWDLNEYEISKENIMSTLPSNQFLRSYDNVPRKALAQDVTGNRVVYGNYIQNYNLDINGIGYKPHISHELVSDDATLKSVKSLREYQLGVVYTDKYGRETPVLTNNTGTFKVEKNQGTNKNKLQLSLKNSASPLEMEFFKFYIKQTSGEYYNVAMDRWYDAEDGNVWVSFNSADRNKINDDTVLVLKKGVDSEELVEDPARFKVVAIENEAPDFIKINKTIISDKAHVEAATATNIFLTGGDLPEAKSSMFSIAYHDNGTHIYSNTVIKDIYDKSRNQDEEFYFQIKNSAGTTSTKPIKIVKINITDEQWSGSSGLTKFDIVLEKPFTSLINSFTNDSTGQSSTKIEDNNRAIFWSYKKENKAEFDGRFFVKLFQEDTFKEYIMDNTSAEVTEYNTLWDQKIYSFDYASHNLVWNGASGNLPGGSSYYYASGSNYGNNPTWDDYISATNDIAQDGSSGYLLQNWKICAAYFRGINIHKARKSGTPGWDSYGISERQGFDGMDMHGDPSSWDFEDVWFLDGATSEGQYSGHWDGSPSGTNHNGVGITGSVMELGFGGIQPEPDSDGGWAWSYDAGGGSDDSDFYKLYDNTLYDNDSEGFGLAGRLTAGVIFRWAEDPTQTVYKINNKATHNLVRHETDQLGGDQRHAALGQPANPYPLYNNIQYHTSTFFRPGNHSKNYVLTVSQVSDPNNTTMPWNPYVLGEIAGGVNIPLVVGTGMSTGGNQITVSDLVAVDISGYNYGARTVQVGMVCEELGAVVSKIDNKTLYFKNYNSNNANPNYAAVSSGDTLHFKQYGMNGISRNSAKNINYWNNGKGFSATNVGVDAVGYTIEILEAEVTETLFPRFPAVFETEPTEETGLDVYHEMTDNLPITITRENISHLIPTGSQVAILAQDPVFGYQDGFSVLATNPYTSSSGSDILIDTLLNSSTGIAIGDEVLLKTPSGIKFNLLIEGITNTTSSPILTIFKLASNLASQKITPTWFNCYSFGNGVESNRVRDAFNKAYISNGVKVSTTLDKAYKQEERKYGLIYSGIYNSISSVNNLNQFIAAEKITKDLNPTYGSIQKLHSRSTADGDLIAFCEDRILKILANKDAVYNADGNPQLTANNNVLGQAIPYSGEYGISKNPESFASEAYRVYFADKVRGTVMRLSMDGLTPISSHGMKDWFRDNLKLNTKLVGSYDDKKDEYNLTLQETEEKDHNGNSVPTTVSFREDVKGWVSFKSFTPEDAISCANEYYTFKDGRPWRHHVEGINRNTFYTNYKESSLTVLLNDLPGSVKSFKTVSYEGSQARVSQSMDSDLVMVNDGNYSNLTDVKGWYVDAASTNLEKGGVTEFTEKEGKWFGYINGENPTSNFLGITTENFNTSDFSIQGIGRVSATPTPENATGCTDNGSAINGAGQVYDPNGDGLAAFNYQSFAVIDDGSCIPVILGCMDPSGTNNFDILANTDDGSCLYPGCTYSGSSNPTAPNWDLAAINYDPNANWNDGSCILAVVGCTLATSFNYDPLANTTCGGSVQGIFIPDCCIPSIYGCLDDTTINGCGVGCTGAMNFDCDSTANAGATSPCADGVNISDGSCIYTNIGCMDSNAVNYVSGATVTDPDDPCLFCGDSSANNNDGASNANGSIYYGGCEYCGTITNFHVPGTSTNVTATSIYLMWDIPIGANWITGDWELNITNATANTATTTSTIMPTAAGAYYEYNVTGLTAGQVYYFELTQVCTNSSSNTATFTQQTNDIPGCMDIAGGSNPIGNWSACNYNALATSDDGSCFYDLCAGCTDDSYIEYCGDCWDQLNLVAVTNSTGGAYNADDGSCMTAILGGCTDSTMFNYNPSATFDDNSCIPFVYGCTDNTTQNNDGTTATTNYNALANTDDGSCIYSCPTIDIQPENFTNGSGPVFDSHKVLLLTDLANSSKSLTLTSNGYPFAYTASVEVTDNSGSIIYSKVGMPPPFTFTQGNFVPIAPFGHQAGVTLNGDMGIVANSTTSITVEYNIGDYSTSPGTCQSGVLTKVYTIGCTDPSADNYDLYNIPDFGDNTFCNYTGCMDATPDNQGNIWATNYNPLATTPCTVNPNTNATGSDNICCIYDDSVSIELVPYFGLLDGGPDHYTDFNILNINFDNTGFTNFKITQIVVGTPGGTGWSNESINGDNINPTWIDTLMPQATSRTQDLTSPAAQFNGHTTHSGMSSSSEFRNYLGSITSFPTITPLAHSPLAIGIIGLFTGQTQNFNIGPSNNGVKAPTIFFDKTFYGGCKILPTNGIAADYSNYDSTLDVHIPDSCALIQVSGCTTSTALNYDPSANTFLADSCCPTSAPGNLAVTVTEASGVYKAEISFNEVCEAISYEVFLSIGDGASASISTITAPAFSGNSLTTGSNLNSLSLITLPGVNPNDELSFFVNALTNDTSSSAANTGIKTSANSLSVVVVAP